MGRLFRGLLLGLGLSLLFVPLRSQEIRRMLSERLRSLRTAYPHAISLPQHPAQPAIHQPAETVGSLRGRTQQITTIQDDTREQAPPVPYIQQSETFAPPIVRSQPPTPAEQSLFSPVLPVPPSATPAPERTETAQSPWLPIPDSTEDISPTTKLPVLRRRDTSPLATTNGTGTKEATPVAQEPIKEVEVANPTYSTQEPDLDMTPISPGPGVFSKMSETPEESVPINDTANADEPTFAVPTQSEQQQTTLSSVPGVTPPFLEKLEAEEIHTIPQLLERASSKDTRTELAQKVGLGTNALRALVSRADLMQLPGLDADTATLMQEANVTGCKDLQRRNPDNLLMTLIDVQVRKRPGEHPPSLEQLTGWITAATRLSGNTI